MKKIHYYFGISAVILAAALIIISLGVVDAPVVYNVPTDRYPTIGEALATANAADPPTPNVIIRLSSGTYSPDTGETFPINLDDYLNLTNITISGTGPADGTGSIIDAGHTANVIYCFRDVLPVSLKLENLQITGGHSIGSGGGYILLFCFWKPNYRKLYNKEQ